MGLTKSPVVQQTLLSPLGKACVQMDLTAVHEILLKTGYKDEEGAENEVSFLLFYCIMFLWTVDWSNLQSKEVKLDIELKTQKRNLI